ncbi:MAG: hypothetical protein QOJ13_374 [Gaiellales bacterium]|nr:hypothetical protein [Gaiellales bacterium]
MHTESPTSGTENGAAEKAEELERSKDREKPASRILVGGRSCMAGDAGQDRQPEHCQHCRHQHASRDEQGNDQTYDERHASEEDDGLHSKEVIRPKVA